MDPDPDNGGQNMRVRIPNTATVIALYLYFSPVIKVCTLAWQLRGNGPELNTMKGRSHMYDERRFLSILLLRMMLMNS
jgi:hypothetical protein